MRTWLIPGRNGTGVLVLQLMVLPSSADWTVARSRKPRLFSHQTRGLELLPVKVPFRKIAGSLVTTVPSHLGWGWVRCRVEFCAKVTPIEKVSQEKVSKRPLMVASVNRFPPKGLRTSEYRVRRADLRVN